MVQRFPHRGLFDRFKLHLPADASRDALVQISEPVTTKSVSSTCQSRPFAEWHRRRQGALRKQRFLSALFSYLLPIVVSPIKSIDESFN